eukprot:458237-Pelagomonas_calceolata.AAC.13
MDHCFIGPLVEQGRYWIIFSVQDDERRATPVAKVKCLLVLQSKEMEEGERGSDKIKFEAGSNMTTDQGRAGKIPKERHWPSLANSWAGSCLKFKRRRGSSIICILHTANLHTLCTPGGTRVQQKLVVQWFLKTIPSPGGTRALHIPGSAHGLTSTTLSCLFLYAVALQSCVLTNGFYLPTLASL